MDAKREGKVILVVGQTGSGKTYFTKQLTKDFNPKSFLVFDVNKEWEHVYKYPFDADIDAFLEKCEKVNNATIIIEDATSFFAVQGRSDRLVKMLIARRHTGNIIILLFHSFGDVPTYIYRKCQIVVVFKTQDALKHVDKFNSEDLVKAWQKVKEDCKGHEFFSKQPPPKGVAPPSQIVNIY